MNNTITLDYPLWFIGLCILLGFIFAFILYFRERKNEFAAWLRWVMAIFRAITISAISFLLLNPLFRTVTSYTEKPLIIFAQDNSSSILVGKDSTYYSNQYKTDIQKILDDLSNDYQLIQYTFGSEVQNSSNFTFSDDVSNISELLDEIGNRNIHRNVGAIIIASDGIINRGLNPVYSPFNMNVPLYTLALGDTNMQKDLIINKVNFNRIAYLENEFPVEVILNARMLSGARTRVTVEHKNKVLGAENITIRTKNDFQVIRFNLKAESAGLQRYTITIDPVKDEISYGNNRQDIFIDILESKQKILLLYDAPHPDVSALKQSLQSNVNYEFEDYLIGDFKKNISEFNLVIFHGLPSVTNPIRDILSRAKTGLVPTLYVLTQETDLSVFNKQNTGIKIGAENLLFNEVLPAYNIEFNLFSLNPSTLKFIENFPPLVGPYGNIQLGASSFPLFYQTIGTINTREPLMIFNRGLDYKAGVILGEGLWKWRLKNYAINSNHDAFDDIFNKSFQYLALKIDKSQFRLFHKNNFTENENIEFEAEVYNEIYEMIDNAEISLEIKSSSGEQFPFNFSPSRGRYYLNAGKLPADSYTYSSRVKAVPDLLIKEGEFTVSALNIENVNSLADHNLLFSLANKYDGEMIFPGQIGNIPEIIRSSEDIKPVIYNRKKYNELLNLPWILGLILFFLSAEWFIRKRAGGY